jgi:anti-sigma factor RsiW
VKENDKVDLDRTHALMMAALDAESTASERRELDALLAERPELRAEWARLQRLKEVTTAMNLRQPPEEVWDRYRVSVLHRAERSIAWILVTVGTAVLGGWALWNWFEALLAGQDTPLFVRGSIMAIVIGLLILLLSVARERWFLHRRDPYSREVMR